MTSSPIRIVVPLDVIGDELPAVVEAGRAVAQRAEIHVGLSDLALTTLAVRAMYPRRPLWRRIITRIGGAR
jgi:hypothetical protein